MLDAEALLLVDDDQAEVLEPHLLAQDAVGADDQVDRAVGQAVEHRLGLAVGLEAGQRACTMTGKPAYRSAKVLACCWTSSVVGHRMATCLPSWIALNAARTAISVLP